MEKKMRKFNKILMMSVAILLCMVLISTSVVSGIFAKFIIKKEATAVAQLKKFNVTVTVTPNTTALSTYGASAKITPDGDSETIDIDGVSSTTATVDNLPIYPGVSLKELFTVNISGTPSVNAKVTVDVQITYGNTSHFTISKTNFPHLSADTATCVPVGFYVNGTAAVTPYNNKTAANAAKAIEDQIDTATSGKLDSANSVASATHNKTAIDISNLKLGFEWPLNYETTDSHSDEIGTWIAKNNPTITYKLIVKVEQQ